MRRIFMASLVVVLGTGCSTMQLPHYPQASPGTFRTSASGSGVAVHAEPLLDKEVTKKYFGVDLIAKKTLAVHLTVRNNHPTLSYTIRAETLAVTNRTSADAAGKPGSDSQQAGEAIGVAAAVLLSPLLMAVAVQQLSNASVIEANFEAKRFRTRTIDPGQHSSGFAYFNWEQVKTLQTPELCVESLDTSTRASLAHCVGLSLRSTPR
jgi:hypothetical protein